MIPLKNIFLTLITLIYFSLPTVAQQYIEFVENKGQWPSNVSHVGTINQGKFGFTQNGYIVNKWIGGEKHHSHGAQKSEPWKGHNWEVKFIGANPNVKVQANKKLPHVSNYYIGNDPNKWGEQCASFTELSYENIYSNIDVKYYTSNNTLKYDIIVHPGGDANKIDILYNGVNKLSKNKSGNLVVETSIGNFEEMTPYTYQVGETGRVKIPSAYEVSGNRISFNIGSYDKSKPLVIDPTIIFSTHSGSTATNWGMTATYGPDETFFGGGWVNGNGFSGFTGTVNGSTMALEDICIIKLSADGNQKLYITYLGGSNEEQPASLIADTDGSLFVLGRTNSPNFPNNQILGAGGDYDIVVAKLNANGSINRVLKIGGTGGDGFNMSAGSNGGRNSLEYNYGDDGRGEINLDPSGNVLVATSTQSNNFFTQNASQNAFGGGTQDAAILKFNNTLTGVIFSTYLGGSGNDAGYVISHNRGDGKIYVAGGTASNNFPGDKVGVLQPTFGGGAGIDAVDGYLTILDANTSAVSKTTYIGTNLHDQVYGLQFDKNNFPYIMGISLGSMPVINASYSNAGSHQFIAKLKKDLSGYEFATKFGTNSTQTNISPVAFLVDNCENIYVSGWGAGNNTAFSLFSNAGTSNMPITPDFLDNTTDGFDFYYMVLERNANSLLFGSFFGGTQTQSQAGEHVDGGTSRFDPKGVIYQAACASCGTSDNSIGYPVVSGGIGNGAGNAGGCNLGMTKIRFNYTGVLADLRASDTTGCAPFNVTFEDRFLNAESYQFDFGDGSPVVNTINPIQMHAYTVPGTYTMRMIAINLNSCNKADTAYKKITVRHSAASLAFNGVKQPPCLNLTYRFDNLSVAPASRPFGTNVFRWDFGDNTPTVTSSGLAPVLHTYAAAGTYNVKLILLDTAYCNYPDSLIRTFILSTTVIANFNASGGCAPHNAAFVNTSAAGSQWQWNVTGPTNFSSTQENPTFFISTPGTYNVRLITTDLATCNLRDTAVKTIVINPSPNANFNFTPNPPQLNTPTQFSNLTTNATSYKWIFGDGDSSTITNPIHQYIRTGTFNTCLYALNQFGCRDTVCRDIPALVEPLIDVPTALTPNGDGVNDYVIPRGFGIETITFRIFNRWGNLLFETKERNVGWDGKYQGTVQPKEVYSYTLEAKMFDGTNVRKSGNITLLR